MLRFFLFIATIGLFGIQHAEARQKLCCLWNDRCDFSCKKYNLKTLPLNDDLSSESKEDLMAAIKSKKLSTRDQATVENEFVKRTSARTLTRYEKTKNTDNPNARQLVCKYSSAGNLVGSADCNIFLIWAFNCNVHATPSSKCDKIMPQF